MIRFPASSNKLNKIATIAVLPLLAFGFVLAVRAGGGAETVEPDSWDPAGTLVVANLVSNDLTIHRLDRPRPATTLALPGAPHELVELNGRLYITLDRADLLVEVDPLAPGILRSLPLPGRPHGIATDGASLVVTLDDAAEVVVIDVRSFEVQKRYSVGDTPHAVAVQEDEVFVTDSRDNIVRRISSDGSASTVPAGELPETIVLTHGLAITGDADANQLSVFDSASMEPVRTVPMPGRPVRIVANGDTLLVSRNHAARLEVLDLPGLEPRASAPVADFPDGICPDPSGRYIGVASNGEGLVTIVSTASWQPLGSLAAGKGPGACIWLATP